MEKITEPNVLPMWVGTLSALVVAAVLATAPKGAGAQALDIDFAVEQAFTTLDDMGTPTGFRVGIALPWALGPVGFDVGYRTVAEHLGERSQRCDLNACTPGPFDTVMRMRAATFGVGWSTMLNPFVELSTGLTGSLTWQDLEYRPGARATSETGPYGTETVGPDPGMGAYASWRFPPLLSALRPFLYARAEWIGSGTCVADGMCFGNRYVGSAGIGMYARIP